MIILLHSSKTMRLESTTQNKATTPQFLNQAQELAGYMKSLDQAAYASVMKISPALAKKTKAVFYEWDTKPELQIPAIDCFLGDIYSGFQVASLSSSDRDFAQKHLRIVSGLYGLLRALDGVTAYRLEMAYRLPEPRFKNLYEYWGDKLAKTIADEQVIFNLSSVEYSNAILPYLPGATIITPKFMTIDPKTKQPKFVVVHAKIARGAMARWLIKNRAALPQDITKFDDLNYRYNADMSTTTNPVFIAPVFGGIGLSVRLS